MMNYTRHALKVAFLVAAVFPVAIPAATSTTATAEQYRQAYCIYMRFATVNMKAGETDNVKQALQNASEAEEAYLAFDGTSALDARGCPGVDLAATYEPEKQPPPEIDNEIRVAQQQILEAQRKDAEIKRQEESLEKERQREMERNRSASSSGGNSILTALDVIGGLAATYYDYKTTSDHVESRAKAGYGETAGAILHEYSKKNEAIIASTGGRGMFSITERLKSGIDGQLGVAAKMASTDGRGLPSCPIAASGWHAQKARQIVDRFASNWFGPGYLIVESDGFCGSNALACITNCSLGGRKMRIMVLTGPGTSLSDLEFTQTVLHEIGHTVLGHLDIGTGHNHKKEIEAQQWSAARMRDMGIPWRQAEPIFRASMDYSHIGGVITVQDNLAAARRGYAE